MLKNILYELNKDSKILTLYDDISSNKDVSIFDISFSGKTLLLQAISKPIIYVVESFDLQNKLKQQFLSMGKTCECIYSLDYDLTISSYKDDENLKILNQSLFKLLSKKLDILIVSSKVLFQKLPSVSDYRNHILPLTNNEFYDLKNVVSSLVLSNYKKVDMVEKQGEFAVRGDILDVFNMGEELPTRIEFFGDEVENIYSFNLENYSKVQTLTSVSILPNSLIFIENSSQIIDNIKQDFKNISYDLPKEDLMRLKTTIDSVEFRLQNNDIKGLENFVLPYLDYKDNLLSYLENAGVIVFDDVKQILDKINEVEDDFTKSFESLLKSHDCFIRHKNLICNSKEVLSASCQKISFQNINSNSKIFSANKVYSFKTNALSNYYGKYETLFEELKYYLEFKNTVLIFAKNESTAVHLQNFLKSKNLTTNLTTNYSLLEKQKVNIMPFEIPFGVNFVEEKLVIIGTNELLGKQEITKKIASSKRSVFTLPKIGDYVVHEIYGIGLCEGIERRKFANFEKDYIVLSYQGGDKIYIPTEQIDLISTYVSSSNSQKLSKLGNQEFIKVKQKVKSGIKDMAFSLLKLYAEREQLKGFKYQEDDLLMKEFENSFPYEETADQIEAINQIKKEMEHGKLVDRLICGDVGYGKTEVALRAIFKAVESGKQVAFLAPTTILSQQHYDTCVSRMGNFMVNIEALNRFKSAKEQKQILKDLKDGKINVIVGTHRLLSKDVEFKDLGLLVLDEEQRFGVQDKEKIKNIKKNVDVLTLSATPIPRTLHMSLSGIRDISLITTAPEGRLPVQTTVAELNDTLLYQALKRELYRDGQAIVVYNSVEHIYSFKEKIRRLVGDDVVIGVAHGQMEEKELEKVIYDLYDRKIQILVSTTLIENGVDLPFANTLIVKDADKLGLSQLYQLRGRVGRGNKLGYAYFTYEKDKVMTEDAYKRLNALMEFTELGSGFKIAMRDLEIRGCGNVMGKEQHGHMDKVGYDMYCKLLNETVSELKGEKVKEKKDVKIDVAINAFIPNDYIIDSDARFKVYNMLIDIKSNEDRLKVLETISQTYGKDMPTELNNLSNISLLRYYCENLDIKRVQINNFGFKLEFYNKESLLNEKITTALSLGKLKYVLNLNVSPIISFEENGYSNSKKLEQILELLSNCIDKKTN
ncbi:MAG: transcription-repair coupling factor [Clostridiales bacterium]|nr:transcription-repair coupling factor [Candidatus Apopatousia equi]